LYLRWKPVVAATFAFLGTMGRGKFVRPLYRDLAGWGEKREEAVTFFLQNKNQLMAGLVDAVSKDLKL